MANSVVATETNHLSPSDVLIVEGALQYGDGDFDKAIASFTKVLQFDPTNSLAIFNRASVYRAKGEFRKSISDFNSYIRLNPTNALAFKNRASAFAAIGEFEKALIDWSEGLRLNPVDATALAMRGFSYEKTGKFIEAQKDYYQAIQIDAKNASAWNNLGWLRATCPIVSMRNGEEAVNAATKACDFSNWTNWTRLDTLAAAFAEKQDFRLAVDFQKRALDLGAPSDKERQAMQNRLALYEQRQPYRETTRR